MQRIILFLPAIHILFSAFIRILIMMLCFRRNAIHTFGGKINWMHILPSIFHIPKWLLLWHEFNEIPNYVTDLHQNNGSYCKHCICDASGMENLNVTEIE